MKIIQDKISNLIKVEKKSNFTKKNERKSLYIFSSKIISISIFIILVIYYYIKKTIIVFHF